VLLAVLLTLTSACCLALCVRHRGRGLEAWHVAMGVGLVVMVATPMMQRAAVVQMVVFGVGAAWCVAALVMQATAGHARLLVGCTAMVAMVVPAALTPAAATMPDMGSMDPPAWLAMALVVALIVVAAGAMWAAFGARCWATRLSTGCEAIMALAMAWLLIPPLVS
jgi:hypothetical protein